MPCFSFLLSLGSQPMGRCHGFPFHLSFLETSYSTHPQLCFHADSKTIELKVDINDHIQMERRQMEQRVGGGSMEWSRRGPCWRDKKATC